MITNIVKVSDKGQIAIPIEMRGKMGINKGDRLLLLQLDKRIVIEKPNFAEEDFSGLNSEEVAKEVWDNEYDEVWNNV